MTNEIANKLVLLNGFRAELGLVALDTWNVSEAKLDLAIVKLQADVAIRQQSKRDAKAKEEVDAMLIRLNNYLAPMGKAEVKEWNGSLDDLAKRVAEAKRAHRDMIDLEKKAAKTITGKVTVTSTKLRTKVAKAAEKKVNKAKTRQAPSEQGLLPRIAAELGLNPKVTRAKLRKAFGPAWRNLTEKEIRKALK
jgi:hypothetical protein